MYITRTGSDMKNKLNAHMDHGWDGFYTSQKRLPRFAALLESFPGADYNITYTGTPPQKQTFMLKGGNPNHGISVRISYPASGSYQLLKNGKYVEFN